MSPAHLSPLSSVISAVSERLTPAFAAIFTLTALAISELPPTVNSFATIPSPTFNVPWLNTESSFKVNLVLPTPLKPLIVKDESDPVINTLAALSMPLLNVIEPEEVELPNATAPFVILEPVPRVMLEPPYILVSAPAASCMYALVTDAPAPLLNVPWLVILPPLTAAPLLVVPAFKIPASSNTMFPARFNVPALLTSLTVLLVNVTLLRLTVPPLVLSIAVPKPSIVAVPLAPEKLSV